MVGCGGASPVVIVLLPPGGAGDGSVVPLDPDEAHHLRVRRAEPGQSVQLRDGAGLVGTAVLERMGGGYAARIVDSRRADVPRLLALAVGAGDKERFGWLVEKAAELGVTDLVPIETEFTGGVASRIRESHLPKLARRGLEAIKQSGAAWAPRLHPPATLAAFIAAPRTGARWLADAAGNLPGRAAADGVTILVGPEGGFTAGERASAIAAGWTPVRLGGNVLRFETAAVAGAVLAGLLNEGER